MLSNAPLIPMAYEEIAIRAGPTMNLNPSDRNIIRIPQAINLDWDAMKRPDICRKIMLDKKFNVWFYVDAILQTSST